MIEHFGVAFRRRFLRQDQTDQLAVEMVFDLDQNGCDLHQGGFIGAFLAGDHGVEARVGFLHPPTQFAQTQHPKRVADLAQQFDLRRELFDLTAAAAHEDIEHVLNARQVFANRGSDRMHELDGWRRKALALLLDGVIDGQQFVQTERSAHGGNARTCRGGTRHVVQQIIQQLDRRQLRVTRFAQFIEPADFAVGQAQQALDRHAALSAVLAQRFKHGAYHPPELEDALLRRHLLKTRGHGSQDLKILFQAFAANPAHQASLKACPQAACPLRRRQRRFTGCGRSRLRLPIGLQIE